MYDIPTLIQRLKLDPDQAMQVPLIARLASIPRPMPPMDRDPADQLPSPSPGPMPPRKPSPRKPVPGKPKPKPEPSDRGPVSTGSTKPRKPVSGGSGPIWAGKSNRGPSAEEALGVKPPKPKKPMPNSSNSASVSNKKEVY